MPKIHFSSENSITGLRLWCKPKFYWWRGRTSGYTQGHGPERQCCLDTDSLRDKVVKKCALDTETANPFY